ncbi:hypothetical protein ABLO27_05890 [Roseibium sp. SCPC15]|uniref:hypothetical protein n=1 Tax=Roseibium sp. SCP15 TaxID=3141376 RepID=UPI003338275F
MTGMSELERQQVSNSIGALSNGLADALVRQHVAMSLLKYLAKDHLEKKDDRAAAKKLLREMTARDAEVLSKKELQPNDLQEKSIKDLISKMLTEILDD